MLYTGNSGIYIFTGVLFVGFDNGCLKSFTIKQTESQEFELLPNSNLWHEADNIRLDCVAYDSTVSQFIAWIRNYAWQYHRDNNT